jgi:hypothetical protein
MTYLGANPQATAVMIEVSLSAAQTASAGDYVLFDTIRATGSHGVSVNSSTGELTLDTSKQYYVQASIDVSRSSTTGSWRFTWVDSSGTEITVDLGGYDAEWNYEPPATTTGGGNATYTAVYQPGLGETQSPIRLKATTLSPASSILTATKLLILEVTQ